MEISECSEPNVDIAKIMKKILSSEPPHAGELEAHVKFAKIWGGGKQQHITQDICSYIKMSETNWKVSASTFESCSRLKCNPKELPAQFIGACIKAIATRGVGRDGVGNLITSKDIKQITSDKRADVMTANAYMVKASNLCAQCTTPSIVASIDKIRGDFECDLVENVFDTFANLDPRKSMSMVDIVKNFVDTIGGADPHDAGVPQPSNPKDTDSTKSNLFDATADDAIHQVLKNNGIAQGVLLQPKVRPNPLKLDSQFEVNHVNEDGSIGIRAIKVDGSLSDSVTNVSMQDIQNYQIIKSEHRMKELPLAPLKYMDFDNFYRMVAEIGLHKVQIQFANVSDMVIIQGAPKVRLIARKDIEIGELTLVPWSTSMQHKPIETTNDCRTYVKVGTTPPKVFGISSPPGLGKVVESAFWRMQEEKKAAKSGNMKWTTVSTVVTWPIDIGLGKTVTVDIAVATNNKVIRADGEIRVFSNVDKKRVLDMPLNVDPKKQKS